ncbi:gliding motility lipoprotein GldD [Aureivirga sp. CE67]|uniref:gliding motility lipoprotein GldD n=1 Tax=Aureivirga sp. CE67 TaxID=1788983 RepID=UPI0018C98990|nr:gliding motility lipoprotein GldD [Aureivirga sp. CE67]
MNKKQLTNTLIFLSFLSIFSFFSCSDEDVIPKPNGFLRLKYPEAKYISFKEDCPYVLEYSDQATFSINQRCWGEIRYPKLKATLHLTYRPINGNLDDVLRDVEKLTWEHTQKADAINAPKVYENAKDNVYGSLMKIDGNVASNIQFHVTDSTKNLLSGALYFEVKPNYDSIVPAIEYIQKDVQHLMESVRWKN